MQTVLFNNTHIKLPVLNIGILLLKYSLLMIPRQEKNQVYFVLPTLLTPNIFPAMTLLTPTGVNHMTPVTIFIITSKIA